MADVARWHFLGYGSIVAFVIGFLSAFPGVAESQPLPISVRVIGTGTYGGSVDMADGSSYPLTFHRGADGISSASIQPYLVPTVGGDGREQVTIRAWRLSDPRTTETLPLAIETFVAPTVVSIDLPDVVAPECRNKLLGSGGEAFWAGQYIRAGLRYAACQAESKSSQLTIDALGYYLYAFNHLVDIDPILYSVNTDLIDQANDEQQSADVCVTRPIAECLFLQRQAVATQVADYKLLAAALAAENRESQLTNEQLIEVLDALQVAKAAFDRCTTGDLKGKCQSLHTDPPSYSRTTSHFCTLARTRQIPDIDAYCTPTR